MQALKITVKQYMTRPASPDFTFMAKFNDNRPMPLRTMVGVVLEERQKMVRMRLHGDITEKETAFCIKCGRPITNPVSRFFGMGPECGGHGYVNPFNTKEELEEAVSSYRKILQNITWEGWVIRSAIDHSEIVLLDDETGAVKIGSYEASEPAVKTIEPLPEPEGEQLEMRPQYDLTGLRVSLIVGTPRKCRGRQSVYIAFDYNRNAVSYVKSLDRRFYDSDSKNWEIPLSSLERVRADFEAMGAVVILTGEAIQKVTAVETVDEIPADFTFKTHPFMHQKEAILYGLNHNVWCLLHSPGLGKSFTAANLAAYFKTHRGYRHCLVIALNSLVWNWKAEIGTHTDEDCRILGERIKKKTGRLYVGTRADKVEDLEHIDDMPYFLITNVESMRDEKIAALLRAGSLNGDIPMVVVDEVHKFKNSGSQQGKGLLTLAAEYRLCLTGTPLLNSPLDLYALFDFCGKTEDTLWEFSHRYAVYGGYKNKEIIGYQHTDELRDRLMEFSVRKTKEEVLDLPPKLMQNDYIEMGQDQSRLYAEVLAGIKERIDQIALDPNPLSSMIRLRQATGCPSLISSMVTENAKFDRAVEICREAVEAGEKIVVFSNWEAMVSAFTPRVADLNPVVITGEVDTAARQEYVNRFQTDPETKVLVATTGAAGTGLTLTAGSVEIFLDLPWNKALLDQACDRCYRIGQERSLTVHILLARGTIDEKVYNLVMQKGDVAAYFTDHGSKANLANYLIS